MKRYSKMSWLWLLIVSSVLFLPLSGFAQQVMELSGPRDRIIEVEYTFPPPTITDLGDGYHSVMVEGERIQQFVGKPGSPVLPMSSVQILLPPDSPGKRYSDRPAGVEVIPGEKVEIEGFYRVEFARFPRPISAMGREDDLEASERPDAAIYGSDSPFPDRTKLAPSLHYLCGHPILALGLFPVEYVPGEGKLSYYRSIKVRINLEPVVLGSAEAKKREEGMKILPRRDLPGDRARVERVVDNPGTMAQYKGK